jgi:hypothetical protein
MKFLVKNKFILKIDIMLYYGRLIKVMQIA